jgi:hypothetical protein
MRAILTLIMVLPVTDGSTLQAQVDYYGRLGATAATELLKDDLIREIEVQQSLAPPLARGASLAFAPRYRAGLEATLTSGGHHATEAGEDTDLGTLRTGSVMLGLTGVIRPDLDWRAGAGLIAYWPSEDEGIFQRGGPTQFLAGAGLDYRPSVLARWELMLSLRYDFHRFTTEELRARGFAGRQGVQRISATIGLARAQP